MVYNKAIAKSSWAVSTISAEFILIWVGASCALFLITRPVVPLSVVESHFVRLAPLIIWAMMFSITAIAHAASIWSRTSWLRYFCCGIELMFWSYIVMSLFLSGDATPSRAHYVGLIIVNLWILIRGPSNE